jgi:hypothetical protein
MDSIVRRRRRTCALSVSILDPLMRGLSVGQNDRGVGQGSLECDHKADSQG